MDLPHTSKPLEAKSDSFTFLVNADSKGYIHCSRSVVTIGDHELWIDIPNARNVCLVSDYNLIKHLTSKVVGVHILFVDGIVRII